MSRYEESCVFCDANYVVEFDEPDVDLDYCPACGQKIPEELDLENNENWEDGWDEDEEY